MKIKKKLRITKIVTVLCIQLILAAWSSKKDYVGNVAVVDDVAITHDQYAKELDYYQKFYSKRFGENYLDKEVDRNTTINDKLSKELVDSMIKDQVMLNDLKSNGIKIDDSKSTSLKKELEKKLGGKDSLKANFSSLGINENDFNNVLYNDSIRKKHYDFFLSNNDIKDSDVLEFYKANELYQRQYKYNILVFDEEYEAKRAKSNLKSSKDFKRLLNQPVKNYKVINSEFVYKDDPYLVKADILKKDKVSDIFKYDDKYMILMVNSYNDNENDMLINAKEIFLEQKYMDYLNKLVKKSKIRLFI